MWKRLAIVGQMVILAASVAPLSHATFLAGSVCMIPADDGAALGTSVGCRYYQVTGAFAGINSNTPQCTDLRCHRTFNTNALFGGAGFGGYNCNQEETGVYAPPPSEPSNQTFYNLIDAQVNVGTCDHIAYYAVQGQSANNVTVNNPGDARSLNCAGTVINDCFTAGDPSNADPTPLTSTRATWGSIPHQIRSIGGFSPVPTVLPASPGTHGCGPNEVYVIWENPIDATPTMKNGVPSPVQGVNLYVNYASCNACPDGETGWVAASTATHPTGQYNAGEGLFGDCVSVPAGGSAWFALAVRVKGPGNGPTSIETGRVGGVGFVGANSQCVDLTGTVARIVSLSARYAGRGTVDVDWTTGSEGGVQGFYVTRATTPAGPYTRVSDLVGATGDGSRYRFADHLRPGLGRLAYYQLQILHNDGTTELSGATTVMMPGPRTKRLGDNN